MKIKRNRAAYWIALLTIGCLLVPSGITSGNEDTSSDPSLRTSVTNATYASKPYDVTVTDSAYPHISMGFGKSAVIDDNESLWVWGGLNTEVSYASSSQPELIPLSGVVDAHVGSYNMALLKDGTVWTWSGSHVATGAGQLVDTNDLTALSSLQNIVQIAGGASHQLALQDNGTVWAWGSNAFGQLGYEGTAHSSVPVQVAGLSDIVAVSATGYHSLALTADGHVWAWGANDFGQAGNGTAVHSPTPVLVEGLQQVQAVSAGFYHSIALLQDGTLMAWGQNNYGELGSGMADSYSDKPVAVSLLNDVKSVSAGMYYNLALKSDGSVWAWGANQYGQSGTGIPQHQSVPVQVPGLTATSIDAGFYTSGAIGTDGQYYAWGSNAFGQLGHAGAANAFTPQPLTSINQQ
ncbi:RCC1 repeat- and reductase domain-containing protein [Paenibacillus sp. J5C_2022]|uniref:RCC1 domain-containing protein n=1 Tax=Paenibacillus sp. J5C2022 TaxID=2977129 RepID=UPI0021CE972C|nr:RCC1 domain-containing protein [Paenibacillus sp. J5C2022]MCU6710652.1 RCC1 repeat- and reductase domain-containing protein [Paenibacillus sp. J5C2022]